MIRDGLSATTLSQELELELDSVSTAHTLLVDDALEMRLALEVA